MLSPRISQKETKRKNWRKSQFHWPTYVVDECWYNTDDVVCEIDELKKVGTRYKVYESVWVVKIKKKIILHYLIWIYILNFVFLSPLWGVPSTKDVNNLFSLMLINLGKHRWSFKHEILDSLLASIVLLSLLCIFFKICQKVEETVTWDRLQNTTE